MAFGIIYEMSDLNVIGGAISAADVNPNLSQTDRQLGRKYWAGGIKDWSTAPVYAGDPYCPLCHICVCTYGTVAEFAALCHRVADAIGGDALYLHAIANDIMGESGHIEPYL